MLVYLYNEPILGNFVSCVQQMQKISIEKVVGSVLRQCNGSIIPQSFLATMATRPRPFLDQETTKSDSVTAPNHTPCHARCQLAIPPDSTLSSNLSSANQRVVSQGYQLLCAQGDREHVSLCKVVIAKIVWSLPQLACLAVVC